MSEPPHLAALFDTESHWVGYGVSRILKNCLYRVCLSLLLAAPFAMFGCDMPPDEPMTEETDSVETDSLEVPSDTGSEQETETEAATTCVEAVLCTVLNPDKAALCLEGMDDDNQTAALELSLCTAGSCLDAVDNPLSFGICLFQSCPDEALACVGAGFLGVYY